MTAVLGPLGVPVDAQLVKRIDTEFVRPSLVQWSILFPKRYFPCKTMLYTYIDTQNDPIIPALQRWIASLGDGTLRAPSYPVQNVVDPRPAEECPVALRDMDPDIWPAIQSAKLDQAIRGLSNAYRMTNGVTVSIAQQPHDERLRQFKRLMETDDGDLSCAQICDCLDWDLKGDTLLLKTITEALMTDPHRNGGAVPVAAWYTLNRDDAAKWRLPLCLWEMRMAAVLVKRMRMANMDLRFLSKDITGFYDDQRSRLRSW